MDTRARSQLCEVRNVQSARLLDIEPRGYLLLKWRSVPSITSLYYLPHPGKRKQAIHRASQGLGLRTG